MKLLSLLLLIFFAADASKKVAVKKAAKSLPTVDLKQKSHDRAEARKLSLVTRSTPRKGKPLPPHVRNRLLRQKTPPTFTERVFSNTSIEKNLLKIKETCITKLSVYLDGKLATVTLSYLVCLALGIDDVGVQKKIGGALGGLNASEIRSLNVDPTKVIAETALNYSASALSDFILKVVLDSIVDGALGVPVWAVKPIIAFLVKKILEKCV